MQSTVSCITNLYANINNFRTSFFGNHHHVDVSRHITGSGRQNTLTFLHTYPTIPKIQRPIVRHPVKQVKMTTRGTSHAGTSGQPQTGIHTTRSVSRQATATPVPTEGSIASPGDKNRKKLMAGEQLRHILTEAKCLGLEEQVAPRMHFKILIRIMAKYDEGIQSDATLALHAFVALLQENENQEQISNRMMDNIAKRVESKLESVLDCGILKMSGMVEILVANQKVLQEASDTLTGKTEALQKLASDLGSCAKEASASTDQLSNTVSLYKEALITASKSTSQDNRVQTPKSNEDPRLTRDLDGKTARSS